MKEVRRETEIDFLKAFAILCVVIGHSIQFSGEEYNTNFLYKAIYSFHMPLFIFISGYLSFFSKNVSLYTYIKKRFFLLVVPFVFWAVFYSFYYNYKELLSNGFGVISQALYNIILSPDKNGLWFLWVIFLCDLVVYYLHKTKYFYTLSVIVVFTLYILIQFNHRFTYLGLELFHYYFLFFIGGYCCNQTQILKKINFTSELIIGILLIVMEFIWFNKSKMKSLLLIESVRYLVGLFAIVSLFRISIRIDKLPKYITWLSTNTLSIYAIHYVFIFGGIYILRDIPVFKPFYVLILFICTLLTSVFSIILINKNQFLRRLMFGR